MNERLKTRFVFWPACISAALTFGEIADAQPNPEELPKSAKTLYSYYGQQAERYAFRLRNDDKPLRYQSQSLLNWSMEGNWFGSVFVWTKADRPLLIGCVGSGPSQEKQMVFHEFHLLTDKPLEPVRIPGYREWTWSPTGGPAPQAVQDAPAVGKSPAGRLTQMKDIARQFVIEMKEGEEPWTLRLLPQPIYRFPKQEAPNSMVPFSPTCGRKAPILSFYSSSSRSKRRTACAGTTSQFGPHGVR